MFERLKILTLMQLSNKTKKHKTRTKRFYAQMAMRILVMIVTAVVIGGLLFVVKDLFHIPINKDFLVSILIVTQALSIVSTTIGLTNDLYHSKDNQILLSLPANNDEIFFSKLIVYYIGEFVKGLAFIVPLLFAYGFMNGMNFWYFVNIIPITFLLPLIAVLLSTVLSVVVVIVSNFLKNHSMVSAVLSIVFIGIIFYAIYRLITMIPLPIQLVELYNSFINGLLDFLRRVAKMGTVYQIIGYILFGSRVVVNYLWVLVYLAGLFIMNFFVCKPLFFRLTSKSRENATFKEHRPNDKESKSLFITFFKKELMISKRSINELLNDYGILLVLPIVMFVLNYIYTGFKLTSNGEQFVLVFNVLITLLLVTASNTSSATAITKEGTEFVLVKTSPLDTSIIAWAKIAFNLIVTSTMIIISFILFMIVLPTFSKLDIWLLCLFVLIVNSSHILWSFQLDILNPKLSDYASTGSLSNNDNVAKSLTIGLLLAVGFAALSGILFIMMKSFGWIVLIVIAAVLFVYRLRMFQAYLHAYFRDIEY